jgi:hypothetical protein
MLTQSGVGENLGRIAGVIVLGVVKQKLEAVVDSIDYVGGKLADSVG